LETNGLFWVFFVPSCLSGPCSSLNTFPLSSLTLGCKKRRGMNVVGKQAVALHNFEALETDELELKVGDVVTIIQMLSDAWWMVRKQTTTPHFPPSWPSWPSIATCDNFGRKKKKKKSNQALAFDFTRENQGPDLHPSTSLLSLKPPSGYVQ